MGTTRQQDDAGGIRRRRAQKCLGHLSAKHYGSVGDQKGRRARVRSGLERYTRQSIELTQAIRSAACSYQSRRAIDGRSPFTATPHLEDDDKQRMLDGICLHQDRGKPASSSEYGMERQTPVRSERCDGVIAARFHCRETTRRPTTLRFRQCDSDSEAGGRSDPPSLGRISLEDGRRHTDDLRRKNQPNRAQAGGGGSQVKRQGPHFDFLPSSTIVSPFSLPLSTYSPGLPIFDFPCASFISCPAPYTRLITLGPIPEEEGC